MAEITIYHNQNCSTSHFAVDTAAEMGVDLDIVRYMNRSSHPSREDLEILADELEDPVTDMIRRDNNFKRLELTEADVETRRQVIDLSVERPERLQRPIIVRDGTAIIGRPKDRVAPFIS